MCVTSVLIGESIFRTSLKSIKKIRKVEVQVYAIFNTATNWHFEYRSVSYFVHGVFPSQHIHLKFQPKQSIANYTDFCVFSFRQPIYMQPT